MWKVQIYSLLLAMTCMVGSKGYSQFSGENPAGDQNEQAPNDTALTKSFLVKDIVISGKKVAFTVELTTPACPLKDMIKNA